MPDRHDPIQTERTDSRSAAALTGFRPYVYRGEREEPPAVLRARERWRDQTARIDELITGPPPDDDELAALTAARHAEAEERPADAVPEATGGPATSAGPARCDGCGYPLTAPGHKVMCGTEAPPAAASAPPRRCDACGYLTSAPGHKVACDG